MSYIKYKNRYEVGDWTYTKRKIDTFGGYFEKGTEVKMKYNRSNL